MADIADIISAASLPERTVSVCVAGSLAAEHERLEAALRKAKADPESLGEKSEKVELAEQIRELEARMQEHSYEFLFRGLPQRKFSDLAAHHAPRKDRGEQNWNAATFPPALVAACAVEPPMTVERAAELLDHLSMGQANGLFETALAVNTGKFDVPFSVSAYATLQRTAEN